MMLGKVGKSIAESVSEVAEPDFTVYGEGKGWILIKGCGEILGYSDSEISVGTAEGAVRICGSRLTLRAFGAGKITVAGKIHSVHYPDGERE